MNIKSTTMFVSKEDLSLQYNNEGESSESVQFWQQTPKLLTFTTSVLFQYLLFIFMYLFYNKYGKERFQHEILYIQVTCTKTMNATINFVIEV